MYVALAVVVTNVGEDQWSFSEMKLLGGFQSLSNANSLVQHRCGQEMTAHFNSANANDDASVVSRLEHHDQDGKVDVRQKLVDSSGKVAKILRFWVQEFDLDVGSGAGGRPPKLFAVLRGRILYDRGDQDDGTTWDEEIVGVYPDIASAERSAQSCCDDEHCERERASERERDRDGDDVRSNGTTAERPSEEAERHRMEGGEEGENRERVGDSPCSVVSHQWEKEGRENSMDLDDSSEAVDEDEGDGQWLAWVHEFSICDAPTDAPTGGPTD
mmetsp:Transcript_57205/g.134248  ORF Transcript_57205/g.134248 Transcript_57205/m.134248 type:complete len:272 (-) Transcript_57205:81-896(-)